MFGLTNADLGYLARMQIDERTKDAKARRLARIARGRRNHRRFPVRFAATH
ncbi:MAG TPA: hypothetical protein VKB55_08430 [Nocardioidaceae bacterium]|jgi:hypothetical protein|nr:hypothetical protein [Nocardioidaceae bacterium]